jgi:hypothetical protein
VSELDALDRDMDESLRREGALWRAARRGCPHPDLLMARGSEVLDEAVRAGIRLHLQTCDECRRLAADLDSLGLEEPDVEAEHRVRERVAAGFNRRMPGWIPAAAVIVLGVGAALWWTRPSWRTVEEPQRMVEHAPLTTPAAPPQPVALWEVKAPAIRIPITGMGAPRSGNERPSHSALSDALEGYRTGKVADSIEPLERLLRTQADSPEVAFYLGVAYLLSNRASDAVPPLERARALAEPGRRDEIDWYLATSHQRAGHLEAARTRLQRLCETQGQYRDRACAAKALLR